MMLDFSIQMNLKLIIIMNIIHLMTSPAILYLEKSKILNMMMKVIAFIDMFILIKYQMKKILLPLI